MNDVLALVLSLIALVVSAASLAIVSVCVLSVHQSGVDPFRPRRAVRPRDGRTAALTDRSRIHPSLWTEDGDV